MGLWSKENAVVLPGILFLAGWALRSQSVRTLLVRLTPHMLILGIYMILRVTAVGGVTIDDWSLVFGDASGLKIFLTVMAIMARYLRLVLVPYPLLHPECYENLPASISVLEGVLSAIVVLGLIGVSVWQLIRGRQQGKLHFWAFGLLFFYGCLVPVSHIVPFRIVMGARFLYLPSLALCLLAGHLAVRAYAHRRWLPLAAGLPVLAAGVMMILSSNPKWTDPDQLYLMVTKCNPDSPSPYNNMGTYRLRQGKPGEALPFFRKAVELAPNYAKARYNLAYSLHLLGRTREAQAGYRATLAIDPDHGRTLNNLGILLQAQGNLTGARECFERAVRANPWHPTSLVNLGNMEQQEGEFAQAEKHFRLALQIAPRLTEARFNLGRLMERTKRVAEAERLYLEILENHPEHAMAHNNLANILKDRKREKEAESHYRIALRADPDCAPAHQNLANLLLSRGDAAGAAELYQAAHRLRPNDIEILLGLGYARQRLGQHSLAQRAAQNASRIAPDDLRVQKLLHLLGQTPE